MKNHEGSFLTKFQKLKVNFSQKLNVFASKLNVPELLFGKKSYNFLENSKIFSKTHDFDLKTQAIGTLGHKGIPK